MNIIQIKTKIFSILITLLVLTSCTKDKVNREVVVDPPFTKFQYSWKEIELKKGTGNWTAIAKGNVFRLFTNDSTGTIRGQYQYNSVNTALEILAESSFIQDADSLYFLRLGHLGKADTIATVKYNLINDELMVIRNTSSNPNIEIKYSKL